MFGGVPGGDLAERAVRIDQRAALVEIGAVEQAGDRDGDEIRIGEIAGAVGEGEALGLDDAMHGLGRRAGACRDRTARSAPSTCADGDARRRRAAPRRRHRSCDRARRPARAAWRDSCARSSAVSLPGRADRSAPRRRCRGRCRPHRRREVRLVAIVSKVSASAGIGRACSRQATGAPAASKK